MNKKLFILIALFFSGLIVTAQSVGRSPEYIKALTSQWKGERFQDGRPKVSDSYLERLKKCTLEQVWGYLGDKGYRNQVETGWIVLKPGDVMVGRVITTQFTPTRPDLDSLVRALGKAEGRSQTGGINTWPIDILTKGDIYVADGYLKVKDGTLIGSSLGNAILARSGNGVIFYGSIRDMQELKETEGFNAWILGHDPSFIRDMTPISINAPIRIGSVTVFPGDVAFANDYGVAFIPAHLCEGLVIQSEITGLRDEFERELLQQAKYPTGEIHGTWSEKIKGEFRTWFTKYPKKTSITLTQIDNYIKNLPYQFEVDKPKK
jgi:regulator of RNase E activity RraA